MDGGWQDRINDELRLLRRAEAWEQLNVEEQALRAGHLHRQSTVAGFLPGWWERCFRAIAGYMPAWLLRTQRVPRREPDTHSP
jgi:hypothetical protein